MKTAKERIIEEFEAHKGEHVLWSDKVYRLIGITEDYEDYYYVLYNGRKIIQASCVGRIVLLKGYLQDMDYKEFQRLSVLNDMDIEDENNIWNRDDTFATKHKKEIFDLCNTSNAHHKGLLTEICWDLN
jgi:hypothetical protein